MKQFLIFTQHLLNYQNNMKKFLFLFVTLLGLISCKVVEPEFRGGEQFKLTKMDMNNVHFKLGAKVFNGNKFNIKVKPSTLDVHIEDMYIGKVHLEEKIKLKKKTESELLVPFRAELEKGVLFKLLGLAGKPDVKLKLTGQIKAGTFIFYKKLDVHEVRRIKGGQLRDIFKF